jgi:hypothetical protein
MPVRAFVQAREMILPDFMVSAEKPGNGTLGGFDLSMISLHPKSPFLPLLPRSGSVIELATLQKRMYRELAGGSMGILGHSSAAFLTWDDGRAAILTSVAGYFGGSHK